MKVTMSRKNCQRLLKILPDWMKHKFDDAVLYDDEYPELVKFVKIRR